MDKAKVCNGRLLKRCDKCKRKNRKTWRYKNKFYCYFCYINKTTKMPQLK